MNSRNVKFGFFALTALIAIVGALLWNRNPEIAHLDSSGTSIVAFGDSLIYGVGSTPEHDFISLVSSAIGEPIINLGVSGNTTEAALERIDDIWQYDPKIVIILLGGNDYLRRVPMDTTFANLGAIVDEIHAHGAAVLLLGVRGGLIRDTYNDRFEKFAREKKVGFVPNVLDAIISEKELMSDAIHPNDAGYRIIANKVTPALKQMIGLHGSEE
jgi:lysophospholipase L1-like esterase